MKKRENLSWNEWAKLMERYSRYIFVLVIFAIFVFYNAVVVPKDPPKKSKSSSQSIDQVQWDITTKNPEKVFTKVLQGRSGDWYRMGVSVMASESARVDVSLTSIFSPDVSIGSFDIAGSDNFQYHEILFQIPAGTFSSVKFMLHKESSDDVWSFAGVKLSGFAVSRLDIKNALEARRLAPTLAGNIERDTKVLVPDDSVSDSGVIFSSHFTAEADFIQNIKLNVKEKSPENSYVLELREVRKSNAKDIEEVSIKKVILAPSELSAVKDEWGNQSLVLPARLERGKEYVVSLKGSGNTFRGVTLSPLAGSQKVVSDGENIATITFGKYAYVEGGAMIAGARVEDFGSEILYTYSLGGEMNDFFNVFNTEGSVKFDMKTKAVVGKQQQRTSFTYRFFTVYPFQKFMLAGRQLGNTEKEVKLEYSLDNAFWREIPFVQEEKEPQRFSLTLPGTGTERVVYVRVSYNGEDKKTGTFGLDRLSVHAELIRK